MVETDLYLFVPRNFELASFGKQSLVNDVRSRVRIALPVEGERGAAALEDSIARMRSRLEELRNAIGISPQVGDINQALVEPALEAAKDLSGVVADALKHRASEHAREFHFSHSLMTIPKTAIGGIENLDKNLKDTASILNRVRECLELSVPATAGLVNLLDEYLSHLYVQYLGALQICIQKCPAPKDVESDIVYLRARANLEKDLASLQEDEALQRMRFGTRPADEESELERESRVVRLGHLKKFFQSKTFVDINRQQSAKKLSESMATIATAFAGITAALVETFGRDYMRAWAWQGLSVICLGVIIYVLRDRMKDRARILFQEKALQLLPDFQQILTANNRRIGRVKEWFSIKKAKYLDPDIVKIRHSASATELERRLAEDVFHVRKIQEVDPAACSIDGKTHQSRALYENTRVNVARYLKHMDNPFKDFGDLDSNGRFTLARSHRVYYFYLLVKTTSGPQELGFTRHLRVRDSAPAVERQSRFLLYRIVLDKNGVVRLENTSG